MTSGDMRARRRCRGRVQIAALLSASLLSATPPAAQPSPDHLTCFRVTERVPKAKYRVALTSDAGPQTCTVKSPAKLACAATAEARVSPAPAGDGPSPSPAGRFLCYQVKCPRPFPPDAELEDQFGRRTVSFRRAQWLCTPAARPAGEVTTTTVPDVTTTTSVPGNDGCQFTDGRCVGRCSAGVKCGAAVGTASCECRAVSCGDADAPECNGACAGSDEACIFSVSGCTCVGIP